MRPSSSSPLDTTPQQWVGASASPFHGLWVVDSDGNTLAANATLEELAGGPLSARTFEAWFAPEDQARARALSECMRYASSEEMVLGLLGAGGGRVPVCLSVGPWRGTGAEMGMALVVRDLRRDGGGLGAESEGDALRRGLVHTLNSSLQTMIGLVGRAKKQMGSDGTIATLEHELARCMHLMDEFVGPAPDHERTQEVVCIGALVEEALTARELWFEAANLRVVREGPERLAALVDPVVAQLAVRLAAGLACDLLIEQGGGTLRVSLSAQGDASVLAIRATGATLKRDAWQEGASSIAARLAALDGRMEENGGVLVVAEEDAGAELTLHFPAAPAQDAAERVPAIAADALPQASAGRRILIVDDEPMLLEVMEAALEPHYEVQTVLSADEGARIVAADVLGFDLIITDLRIPGSLDGIGLYRELRATRPDQAAVLVFCTADTLLGTGADTDGRPCLKKPFRLEGLTAFVAQQLAL